MLLAKTLKMMDIIEVLLAVQVSLPDSLVS
jgi:hypothetical protein